jgi:hypothetical protein
MTPHIMKRTAFGFFLIFCATAAVLGLLGDFGIKDTAILGIVGGGVFYATMRMIDPPS